MGNFWSRKRNLHLQAFPVKGVHIYIIAVREVCFPNIYVPADKKRVFIFYFFPYNIALRATFLLNFN